MRFRGVPFAADDLGVCADGGRHRRGPLPLHRAPHDLRRRRHRAPLLGRRRRRMDPLPPHLHAATLLRSRGVSRPCRANAYLLFSSLILSWCALQHFVKATREIYIVRAVRSFSLPRTKCSLIFHLRYHPSHRFPTESCSVDWSRKPGYSSVYLVSAVFLPICVVVVCYSLILQVLEDHL